MLFRENSSFVLNNNVDQIEMNDGRDNRRMFGADGG